MADILIKDFPMNLNGKWGVCSEHIVIHGDGSVTDAKGRNIENANAITVVRCRDCEHYYFADNRIPQEQRYVCEINGEIWKPDDFCSFGKRREE